MVADREYWECDVFHSLGCYFMFSGSAVGEWIFPDLSHIDKPVTKISSIFKQLSEVSERYRIFTASSLRIGAANQAAANPHISLNSVIQRGGWDFTGVTTAFEYMMLLDNVNHEVGRVLAGWPDPKCGAVAPELEIIGAITDQQVRGLISDMFCYFGSHYLCHDKYYEFGKVLLASILMYLEDLKNSYGCNNAVYIHVMSIAKAYVIAESTIIEWGRMIRRTWITRNALYLNSDMFTKNGMNANNFTVPVSDVHSMLSRVTSQQEILSAQVTMLQNNIDIKLANISTHLQQLTNLVTDTISKPVIVTEKSSKNGTRCPDHGG